MRNGCSGDPHGVKKVAGAEGEVKGELRWLHRRIEELGAAVAEAKSADEATTGTQELVRLASEAAGLMLYEQSCESGRFRLSVGLPEILGYEPDEVALTREWWWSQVHPEDRPRAESQFGSDLLMSGESRLRYRIRRKDGALITVEETGKRRSFPPGSSIVIGCVRHWKPAERAGERLKEIETEEFNRGDMFGGGPALQDQVHRLQRWNRDLMEFATMASRDLRDPIRKILVFGEMVAARCCGSDETSEYLARMHGAARRMQSLLDSLLVYSGAVSGTFSVSEVNLGEAVREAVSGLEERIREAGAEITVEPLPVVEGDGTQMVHLFRNLIDNALTFHQPGKPPFVRVSERPGDGHPGDSGSCEILVEDHGIGFEERHLERIFLPFERLHGRDEYPGIGMGLAVCKKIAERHGGRISACSVRGKGSIFVVVLPTGKGFNEKLR